MATQDGVSRLLLVIKSYDDAVEVAFVVAVAVVAVIAAVSVQCASRAACLDSGQCGQIDGRIVSWTCPFVTLPSLAGDLLYEFDLESSESLLRGPCSPGERVGLSAIDSSRVCVPHHSWPDAFNDEIADPDAASFHDKACGAWLEAGATLGLEEPVYWSFHDSENQKAAIKKAQDMRFASSRLDTTDAGKFYQSCVSTAISGTAAVRASAVGAFEYLRTGLLDSPDAGVAWLATHACLGPAQLGIGSNWKRWFYYATQGSSFSSGAMASALFVMGEGAETQLHAEDANAEVNRRASSADPLTTAQWTAIYEHAVGPGEFPENSVFHQNVPHMNALLEMANEGHGDAAMDYLLGVAAMCALSLDRTMQRGVGTVDGSVAAKDIENAHESLPKAVALGSLRTPNMPLSDLVDDLQEAVHNATTTTWVQMDRIEKEDAAGDCMELTRYVFPDELSEMSFELLVPDALHHKIANLSEVARLAVAEAVTDENYFSRMFLNNGAVRDAVMNTRIQFAGAPRGAYGSINAERVATDTLTSDDGVMTFAVKHARELWLDRAMRLVHGNAHLCEGPPVYDPLAMNAYVNIGDTGCITVLQGLLAAPFADERYDDASLLSRLIYIVAHEFAHQTLVTGWDQDTRYDLLSYYEPTSTHAEAIADVVAVVALIRAGLATANQICMHTSQLWCARMPELYITVGVPSHPLPNERGDALCATLRDKFGYAVE
jgi:hypothetical protein